MENKEPNQPPIEEQKPPFFKKWSGLYWMVIGFLAFLILFFYWVTSTYNG